MRSILAFLALACASALFTVDAQAQYDEDMDHRANRDRLNAILSKPGVDDATREQDARAFLATLPPRYALRAQSMRFDLLRDNGSMTRLEYGKAMVGLFSRDAPNLTVQLDYYRYYVMIAAKLERGEIPVEEFDYLQGKKLDEAKATLAERRERAERKVDEAKRASAAEDKARADAQARQEAADREAYLESLRALSDRMKARRDRQTTTRCTQMGPFLDCTTN